MPNDAHVRLDDACGHHVVPGLRMPQDRLIGIPRRFQRTGRNASAEAGDEMPARPDGGLPSPAFRPLPSVPCLARLSERNQSRQVIRIGRSEAFTAGAASIAPV
ncbi:hypothetical protein mvi_17260 [Methylobacterium indicum]|uniref:Uncharacterized protein n=1 Tax=Methylobacterium indicum TaxID=1775910 RepID=A0A8H8WS42_9HYPH|nr:hypothetical protein mvi_17260 [Methylobacterium indicum]